MNDDAVPADDLGLFGPALIYAGIHAKTTGYEYPTRHGTKKRNAQRPVKGGQGSKARKKSKAARKARKKKKK